MFLSYTMLLDLPSCQVWLASWVCYGLCDVPRRLSLQNSTIWLSPTMSRIAPFVSHHKTILQWTKVWSSKSRAYFNVSNNSLYRCLTSSNIVTLTECSINSIIASHGNTIGSATGGSLFRKWCLKKTSISSQLMNSFTSSLCTPCIIYWRLQVVYEPDCVVMIM